MKIISVLFLSCMLLAALSFVSNAATISSCQDITVSDYYSFTADIAFDGTNDSCINITVSDVVIDGAGYNITGAGNNSAIRVDGSFGNITVKNTKIYDVDYGVYINNTNITGFNVSNNTIEIDSVQSGIPQAGVYANLFEICSHLDDTDYTIGDLSVSDNNIRIDDSADSNYGTGIRFYAGFVGYNISNSSSCTLGDIALNNNIIVINDASTDGGIYLELEYFGQLMNQSEFAMGNIELVSNEVNRTGDIGGIYLKSFDNSAYTMHDSSFTMGSLLVNQNIVRGGGGVFYDAIYASEPMYYIGYDMYNSNFTMSNIEYCDNEFYDLASGGGLDLGQFIYDAGEYLYDNSNFTMGDIKMNGNKGDFPNDAIYIASLYYNTGYEMYNSSFKMGSIQVNDNMLNVTDGRGIETGSSQYLGYNMYNRSTFTMNNIEFRDNYINNSGSSGYEGMKISDPLYYAGTEMHEYSDFSMGDVNISGNVVNSNDGYGIYMQYLYYYLGSYLENSTFSMGGMYVNSNDIDATNNMGFYIDEADYIGYELYNSTFTMDNIEAVGNDVTGTAGGFEIDYILYDAGENMYYGSSFTMGDVLFNDNTINASGGTGVYIGDVAYNSGYEMHNSTFAMGDIQFKRNTITSANNNGLEWNNGIENLGYQMYEGSDFTMGDIDVSDNEINITGDYTALYTNKLARYFGYIMYNFSTFDMGSIKVNSNSVYVDSPGSSGSNFGIYIVYPAQYLGYDLRDSSSFVMQNMEFMDNSVNITGDYGMTIGDCSYGYLGYLGYEMYNSTFSMGNVTISGNDINATGPAYYAYDPAGLLVCTLFEEVGVGMYDSAVLTAGDFKIINNDIIAPDKYGVYISRILYDVGNTMYNNSNVTVGNVEINYNTIDAQNSYGIAIDSYLYYSPLSSLYDDATATIGYVQINYNNITNSSGGIYIYDNYALGSYIEDNAAAEAGNLEIIGNDIYANYNEGIYFNHLLYMASYQDTENSTLIIGDTLIKDNTVNSSTSNFIHLPDAFDNAAYNMADNASADIGLFEISGNTLEGGGTEGIYMSDAFTSFADSMHGNSTLVFDGISVHDNVLSTTGGGITIRGSSYFGAPYEDAVVAQGQTLVQDNNITCGSYGYGIELTYHNDSLVTNNIVYGADYGIYLSSSNNNTIYNNDFNDTGAWDDGTNNWNTTKTLGTNIKGGSYLGGNYWSDYAGTDTNADGLGDTETPYNSSENIVNGGDYLPIYAGASPIVSQLMSPGNNEYILSSTVPLKFYAYSASNSTVSYNITIDGAVNQTGTATSGANTTVTLSDVANGSYSWNVTVWDGSNTKTSSTSTFNVLIDIPVQTVTVPPIDNTTVSSGIIDLASNGVPDLVINQTGVTGYEYLVTTNGSTPTVSLNVSIFLEPAVGGVSDISSTAGAITGFYYTIAVNDSSWYDNVTTIQLRIYYNISNLDLPSGYTESSLRPVRYTSGSWIKLDCSELSCTATLRDGTLFYAAGADTTNKYVWANLSRFSTYGISGTTTTSSPSTTGGGGGGGSGTLFAKGTVNESNSLKLTIAKGQIMGFNFGREYHSVKLARIEGNIITIVLNSEPVWLYLAEGQSKQADITGDGVSDIEVSALKVTLNNAEVQLSAIAAPPAAAMPQVTGAAEAAPEQAPAAPQQAEPVTGAAPAPQPAAQPAPAEAEEKTGETYVSLAAKISITVLVLIAVLITMIVLRRQKKFPY